MAGIGIYVGGFDPVHRGHILAAQRALRSLELEELWLVPERDLPPDSATLPQRLEMLRLATAGLENLRVCGPEEAKALPGEPVLLWDWESLPENGRTVLENPIPELSSAQLRRMLVFRCGDVFLPQGVGDYIRSQGLYGVSRDYRSLPMEELEAVVISLLKPNRVAHVLGCRDTAAALARRWGADVTDAARAGLLHDITKALDGPLQLTLCEEYGTLLDDFSRKYPKTLHALTGALVAEQIFGENPAVVDAICAHTTGKAAMNLLEKIIYVADYMEPCRNFPGVEALRKLADTDMDAALKCGLEMTLRHLANQGAEVSPASREALAYLNRN